MDTNSSSIPLQSKGLAIGYQPKKGVAAKVADNLNLQLLSGELVCLLGPNGTGKSTLIRTLCGMQPALAGDILLNGQSIASLSPKQRAQRASVVLTDSVGSGLMTVSSLVALGRHPRTNWTGALSKRDRQRIDWALDAVDAIHLANRYLGELSDGERQKTMIARALAQDAPLMLLDEPTAFIDLTRRVELMRILRDLAHREGLSILVSTHDLDLALRSADRLWLLTESEGLQQGLPESLALNGKLAAAFASNTLDWDTEQGAFRLHREPCLTVHLSGSGPAAIWTQRLLARLGYGVDNNASQARLTIKIDQTTSNKPIWKIRFDDQEAQFDSLDVFDRWLRKDSSNHED